MNVQGLFRKWTELSVSSSSYYVRQIFRIFKFLLNRLYLYYIKIVWPFSDGEDCCDIDSNIIISMTSFPKRIGTVWISIESIFRQSVKPRIIYLWLSKDQFGSKDNLPSRLLKYQKRGLVINFVDEDLRSHKKYHYIDDKIWTDKDCIVTIDDDIIYDKKLLERLIFYHNKFPQAIICDYGHRILHDKFGELKSYNDWGSIEQICIPVNDAFFGSGGGTLFPKNSLYKDLNNKELFMQLTPFADDIWLNCMAKFNGTKICCLGTKFFMYNTFDKSSTLISFNITHNDEQLAAMASYYGPMFNVAFGLKR